MDKYNKSYKSSRNNKIFEHKNKNTKNDKIKYKKTNFSELYSYDECYVDLECNKSYCDDILTLNNEINMYSSDYLLEDSYFKLNKTDRNLLLDNKIKQPMDAYKILICNDKLLNVKDKRFLSKIISKDISASEHFILSNYKDILKLDYDSVFKTITKDKDVCTKCFNNLRFGSLRNIFFKIILDNDNYSLCKLLLKSDLKQNEYETIIDKYENNIIEDSIISEDLSLFIRYIKLSKSNLEINKLIKLMEISLKLKEFNTFYYLVTKIKEEDFKRNSVYEVVNNLFLTIKLAFPDRFSEFYYKNLGRFK